MQAEPRKIRVRWQKLRENENNIFVSEIIKTKNNYLTKKQQMTNKEPYTEKQSEKELK